MHFPCEVYETMRNMPLMLEGRDECLKLGCRSSERVKVELSVRNVEKRTDMDG